MPLYTIPFPNFDPVLINVGPFPIRWYAFAYVIGILAGWLYARKLVRSEKLWGGPAPLTAADCDDFVLWCAIGMVLGGRIGYVLFYNRAYFLAHPLEIFDLTASGKSFHGALLAILLVEVTFARWRKIPFLSLTDVVSAVSPIGLFFGRIANFVNGELWGRASDVPWAMVFPDAGPSPRHPSQLYEAALEGLVLFIVMALLVRAGAFKRRGTITGVFAIGYGVARIVCEFFREPDEQLGFVWGGLTMGMLLSLPMILVGVVILVVARRTSPGAGAHPQMRTATKDDFASGVHHVTLITGRVQANVDFYAGFLGLRLVKRTGGYEDGEQLHLFYGDRLGSPGSLVTFLVWQDGHAGRVGNGQVSEIAFAVPQAAIGEWMTRALAHGVPVTGPSREFGEPVLRVKDPDGVIVKLVGADVAAVHLWGAETTAVRRLRAVTILTGTPQETAAFVARFGYRLGPQAGNTTRMLSDTDAVDIRDAFGYMPGISGTGIADHVAFRAADVAAVQAMQAELFRLNSSPTSFHDRKYFTSLYVREPGGTLLELATDGPGFTVDEAPDRLGETLFVPPRDGERAEALRVMLPQFAMPGKERPPTRDLPFVHRFHTPDDPDGSTIVLMHGTGGNEADLMPLGHRIAPRATLLGVRGRAHEEGVVRWFRRLTMTSFDQDDIRAEAEAFAAFVDGAVAGYRLDPSRMTFLGYSNGANFAAAVMGLHPGTIRCAILLRATPVLEALPQADLTGVNVLMLTGTHDAYGRYAPLLESWLRDRGADLDARTIEAGLELAPEDTAIARQWLEQDGGNGDA